MKTFLSILLVFLIAPICFSETILLQDEQPSSITLESFVDSVVNKLKNADFESLFNDFYIPKDYNNKDIQNDKEAITSGLRELIQNTLGLPDNYSRMDNIIEQLITVKLGTGTHETTVSLPSQSLFYKITFSKFGDGYINIVIYKDGRKFRVTNIIVGLPVSNPKSLQITQDFVRFMMGIAVQQRRRDLLPDLSPI